MQDAGVRLRRKPEKLPLDMNNSTAYPSSSCLSEKSKYALSFFPDYEFESATSSQSGKGSSEIEQSMRTTERKPNDCERKAGEEVRNEETEWSIGCQIFLPYLIAGAGMVGAGTVLNIVKRWPVFVEMSEIIVLVPALLGLKGNLEMTLASRLSTQANLGVFTSPDKQRKLIGGNLALTQVQAVVVGLLAAVFAVTLTWLPRGDFNFSHALLLCTSSILTASLASLLLGAIVSLVVIISTRYNINPDNVATPIAGSLGDLSTILILGTIASALYTHIVTDDSRWLAACILLIELLLVPLWCYISYRNLYTQGALLSGWMPVVAAMMISSFGGLILDRTILHYEGLALFQPVINGVGGNLVSIQASRLSTSLHQIARLGQRPAQTLYGCASPLQAFCSTSMGARSARVLLFLVLPGQLLFAYIIRSTHHDEISVTSLFFFLYATACIIQVALLLQLAHWLVHYQWSRGDDPDTSSIPYLTAVGDLLGAVLLAAAFYLEWALNV